MAILYFRLWEVYGGVDGLTCTSINSTDEYMLCKDLDIRKCTDRTVYCSFPSEVELPAKIETLENPVGSKYGVSGGKQDTLTGNLALITLFTWQKPVLTFFQGNILSFHF